MYVGKSKESKLEKYLWNGNGTREPLVHADIRLTIFFPHNSLKEGIIAVAAHEASVAV